MKQIALGGFHGCAVMADQTVQCWGWNEFGQLGDGSVGKQAVKRTPVVVPKLAGVKQLSIGENHSCALHDTGAVSCWGSNEYGQLGRGSRRDSTAPVAVAGLQGVVEISTGGYHSCARLTDGALRCWGSNGNSQLGDGSTHDRDAPVAVAEVGTATQIVAGREHSCALRSDGAVWCWGRRPGLQFGRVTADGAWPGPVSL
ncbi:hypothetical protein [Nannocystis sp.]|uniref:RCC1 domain-containing protein n=1 Tax=Nannocystis sp. TaxID=1962667 RepID=UPI0025F1746A|nr:hypothetical protein [Nannocystis sp.]MBK7827006.1 hypothetical protein [Nannocystis sp.]